MTEVSGCAFCGHLIGYHWPEDEHCTVKDCDCSGYAEFEAPILSKLPNPAGHRSEGVCKPHRRGRQKPAEKPDAE